MSLLRDTVWCWMLFGGAAQAAELLSIDEAMREAAGRAPSVREARRDIEASEGSVLTADGGFDPLLVVDGGWNRSVNRQRFGQFPDPFRINSDGWDAGLTLSGQAPTGTSATLSTRFRESTATVALDGEEEGALGAIFGGDQVQKTFSPSFNLEVGQELLRGIRLRSGLANIRRAREARTLSELRMEQATQQAIADASRQYWAWVYRARVVEIEREGVETAEEALRVGAARVQAGRAAPVERTRLEAARVQAEVQLINAENEAARARDELLVTLGRTPGEEIEPASMPGEVPEVTLDLGEAMAEAQEFSVDLAVAKAQVAQARAALADARHALLPQLTASFNAGLNGFDDTSWPGAFDFLDTLLPTVGVRGTLSVPLGNRAAAGERHRSSAEVARAEVNLERAEAQLAMAIASQVRQLRVARTQVRLADANHRLALETLDAEEARYEAGRVLLQDVLEARFQARQAEAESVRSRTDFRVAEVEFRRLRGVLGAG